MRIIANAILPIEKDPGFRMCANRMAGTIS